MGIFLRMIPPRLKQNEDNEDFTLALRKSYEPTKPRGSERISR